METLEIFKTHVLMSKEEYLEYVQLKTEKNLAKKTQADHPAIKIVKHLIDYASIKDELLELLFRRDRMGSDTRSEQTTVYSNGKLGNYFGFENKHAQFLIQKCGYTIADLLAYINAEWDIREGKNVIEEAIKNPPAEGDDGDGNID